MKKGWIAFILSFVALFSSCGGAFTPSDSSVSSKTESSMESSEMGSSNSSTVGKETDETHKDENDDGICDDCGETVTVTFDFFALNDLHGKFDDTDDQPGVDELTTYLKNAKAENENTIFLSSGDMWQGSSESNLTKGLIMTDWMNELGFTSMTMGNHEYDWGKDSIITNEAQADFPFLAINIFDASTHKLVEYCQPSVMIEKSGVQIGIIGAIGDCYSSISSDKVQDVYFETGSALTALVKAEAQELRQQGADYIVYSLHDGYGQSYDYTKDVSGSLGYYDVALSEGYVDLVFEGHTHQHYVIRDNKGVYHLQGGGDNDGITHVEVTINYVNDTSIVHTAEYIPTSRYSTLADDSIVEELLEKYAEQIALAGKKLGYNAKYRSSNELRQILAQLYYEAGLEKWGEEYEIVLGGGFMSARSPYNLYVGEVIYSDIQMIFPFDNEIVLCSISGYHLKYKFFETSNSNYYIAYGKYGESVRNSIDYSKTYYVITDRYSSQYAPNKLTEIEVYDATTFARDLLADYIEAGGLA